MKYFLAAIVCISVIGCGGSSLSQGSWETGMASREANVKYYRDILGRTPESLAAKADYDEAARDRDAWRAKKP